MLIETLEEEKVDLGPWFHFGRFQFTTVVPSLWACGKWTVNKKVCCFPVVLLKCHDQKQRKTWVYGSTEYGKHDCWQEQDIGCFLFYPPAEGKKTRLEAGQSLVALKSTSGGIFPPSSLHLLKAPCQMPNRATNREQNIHHTKRGWQSNVAHLLVPRTQRQKGQRQVHLLRVLPQWPASSN